MGVWIARDRGVTNIKGPPLNSGRHGAAQAVKDGYAQILVARELDVLKVQGKWMTAEAYAW